nr:MAG TPA: hypothetical protein [Crassvirales sp.]
MYNNSLFKFSTVPLIEPKKCLNMYSKLGVAVSS